MEASVCGTLLVVLCVNRHKEHHVISQLKSLPGVLSYPNLWTETRICSSFDSDSASDVGRQKGSVRRAVDGELLATWRQCGARSHLPKRLRWESRFSVLHQTQGSALATGYHCLRLLREKYFLNSYIAASQNLCQVNVKGVNLYRTGVTDPESVSYRHAGLGCLFCIDAAESFT